MCSAAKNNREVNKRFSQKQQEPRQQQLFPGNVCFTRFILLSENGKAMQRLHSTPTHRRTHGSVSGSGCRSPDPISQPEREPPLLWIHTLTPLHCIREILASFACGQWVSDCRKIYQSALIPRSRWAVSNILFECIQEICLN